MLIYLIGYSNYRHQSDIMALSTILHSDENNIVTTFIYDDIAYNHKNPFKGEIFNDHLHTNIYNKSYINSTEINMDSINKSMSFQFTKNDTLFIYYNNHELLGCCACLKIEIPDTKKYMLMI